MGKIARKSTNYRTKREKDNSITDGKYLILMLLSSIVVGAITGWFFMTIKPVKKYSTTLPNSQNRNEDSLLKSSFNSPPVNSPTPVQLTTPPISNRFSGSLLPENTLAPKKC